MKRVLLERVNRAGRLLDSPQARGRTVTRIAFACGFDDLSHFGRVFEAQFGMPPSRWHGLNP